MRPRNDLARWSQIETFVTFLWYGGVAGGGLRSVGWKYPTPSTSGCSILPIARRFYGLGFWTFPPARALAQRKGRVDDPPASWRWGWRSRARTYLLHRLINDALKTKGPDLIPLGPNSYEALIEATIHLIEEEDNRWSGLVREDDYPINVEGAAFRENGTLLLGLRFPVSADGRPILVEIEGVERLFEPGDELPEVAGLWVVDAVGREGEIAGVRDLALLTTADGEELHLVTGNVDSRDRQSVLIQDYPGGRNTVATHFRSVLPPGAHSGFLEGEFVREFPDLPRVEGVAIADGGRFFYVTDEDEGVHLRLTRLIGSAA